MNYLAGAVLTTFILFHGELFCNMINEDQYELEMV